MKIDSAALIFYQIGSPSTEEFSSVMLSESQIHWYIPRIDHTSDLYVKNWNTRFTNTPEIQILGKKIPFAHDRIIGSIRYGVETRPEYPLMISVIPLPLEDVEDNESSYLPTPEEMLEVQKVFTSPDSNVNCILLLQSDCISDARNINEEVIATFAMYLGINVQNSAAMPSRLDDIVLLPPLLEWVTLPYRFPFQCAALSLNKNRLFDSRNNVVLPHTILHLIKYNLATMAFQRLTYRLSKLPLAYQTISEYIESIDMKSDSILSNYLSRYIKDRERIIEELIETSRFADTYSEEISQNKLTELISRNLQQNFEYNSHFLRYSILSRFTSELESNKLRYTQLKELIQVRERIINDFVRDHLSAQVAKTNLDIQQHIKKMTKVAIIIGFLSLLAVSVEMKAYEHIEALANIFIKYLSIVLYAVDNYLLHR